MGDGSQNWVNLTGPVGLRGRVSNVTNLNADQQKVIQLLATIPFAYGGKQDVWPVPPLAGASGVCPKALADAIWDFQSHWKLAGLFKNIDGVVDPGGNTIKQLNFIAAGLNGKGNLPSPVPVPPFPPGPPEKRASTGEWWITAVDTFGLPIKPGVSVAKIAVSLLNDLGDKYTINGYGSGVAEGADFGVDQFGKVLGKLAEVGLKAGDIANIHSKLSSLSFYSKTAGAVFKRGSMASRFTIDEITKQKTMTITNAAGSSHYGVEIGLITFFPSSMIDPINFSIMLGRIGMGQPWGAYGNFSGGKIALEVGLMQYLITSVDKA